MSIVNVLSEAFAAADECRCYSPETARALYQTAVVWYEAMDPNVDTTPLKEAAMHTIRYPKRVVPFDEVNKELSDVESKLPANVVPFNLFRSTKTNMDLCDVFSKYKALYADICASGRVPENGLVADFARGGLSGLSQVESACVTYRNAQTVTNLVVERLPNLLRAINATGVAFSIRAYDLIAAEVRGLPPTPQPTSAPPTLPPTPVPTPVPTLRPTPVPTPVPTLRPPTRRPTAKPTQYRVKSIQLNADSVSTAGSSPWIAGSAVAGVLLVGAAVIIMRARRGIAATNAREEQCVEGYAQI